MADTPTSPPTVPEAHACIARTTRPSPADALAVLKEAAAGQKLRAGSAGGGVGKKKGARGGGPARRASEPAVREGSSFVACPVCEASVSRALLDAHVNECLESGGRAGGSASQLPPAAEPPPHPQPTRPSPPAPAPTTTGPSALAALMAAQRAASRVHTLYAEFRAGSVGPAHAPGAWFWHWAPDKKAAAALPQPAWAGDSTLNLAALAGPAGCGEEGAPAAPPPPPPVTAKVQLRLATNVVPGDGGGAGRVPFAGVGSGGAPLSAVRASPSVLKSALQKNVRLGRGAAAVRLALHMLRTDPGDLLRRLVVVMIEDTLLHPALPLCVWAMAAGAKGYTLPRSAVAALLRVVWQLAGAPVRDDPAAWVAAPRLSLDGLFAEAGDEKSGAATAPPTLAAQLPPEARLLVRCLAARAAYGGMACDVAMLRDAAGVWAARLAGAAGHPPVLDVGGSGDAPPPPITDPGAAWLAYIWRATAAVPPPPPGLCDAAGIATAPPPSPPDVPLSAIDFHVSGVADDALLLPPVAAAAAAAAVRAGGEDEGVDGPERVRRAMWLFRSSINRRPRVVALSPGAAAADREERADLLPLWRVLMGPADAWSANYIRERFPAG